MENFVSYDSDNKEQYTQQNEIDFDKDVDDILKEIENDPELQIHEGEIDKVLKEIEKEAAEPKKPEISINTENFSAMKASFKKSEK